MQVSLKIQQAPQGFGVSLHHLPHLSPGWHNPTLEEFSPFRLRNPHDRSIQQVICIVHIKHSLLGENGYALSFPDRSCLKGIFLSTLPIFEFFRLNSKLSDRVVLPASTCASMPMISLFIVYINLYRLNSMLINISYQQAGEHTNCSLYQIGSQD